METFENTPHVWLHLVDEDSHADEEQGEHPDSEEKPQEILVAWTALTICISKFSAVIFVYNRVYAAYGGRFPRVFGEEFGDKFSDEFSESPNLVMN